MIFDPLAWGLGLALNRLTARVLKPSPADELRARLNTVAAQWAKQLPSEASVGYERMFLEAAAEPDPELRPARFRLQESLYTVGVVPSEQMWSEAFVEHWHIKRAELGERGNAFLQLDLNGRLHTLQTSLAVSTTCAKPIPTSRAEPPYSSSTSCSSIRTRNSSHVKGWHWFHTTREIFRRRVKR